MKVLVVGSGGREHALYGKLFKVPGWRKCTVLPATEEFPQ